MKPKIFRLYLLPKKGAARQVELSINTFQYKQKSAEVVIARDITEHALLEQQLIQAEKLASLGQLITGISHELGKGRGRGDLPNIKINSYPVQEKYGLIWVFPGDPDLAETIPMPAIPQLDQETPWEFIPIDVKLEAHYSMMLENVCDFNHAFLHRKFKPFTDPHLLGTRHEGDIIYVDYETENILFKNNKLQPAKIKH